MYLTEIYIFNDNNPYTIKLGTDEVNSCEGLLTIQECLASLKQIKNCKSPGIDGFTAEFYKKNLGMTLRYH